MAPNVRPLSPELTAKAESELGEDPSRLEEDLQALKDWLQKQPHLKARTDDQSLVTFLRGCKFSLQRAKEKLDMYYTMRTALPEFIRYRDPLDTRTQEVMKLGVGLILPLTDGPAGPRISLIRPGAYDPNKYSIIEVMRVSSMMQDYMLFKDDNMIIAGNIAVLDLANVNLSHLTQMTPSIVKKMTAMGQEASPLRQKGLHYINMPSGMESVMNMFRSFMNEKNRSRLYIHSDFESLHKHIPQRILPKEYGGEAGTLQEITDMWIERLNSSRDYFKEEDNYGTCESKRPGKPKTTETLFGIEGSFRKLTVD